MTQRIRHRLTYANIMSTIAVFAALGGGAYAAAQIGPDDIQRNAVRSKHIKKNQVGRKHLKRKAVSTAKIAGGAVTGVKLRNGAVTETKLADGAVTGAKVEESTLGIVPNADLIDGVDSTELMRGRGRTVAGRATDAPSGSPSAPLNLADGQFTLACQNPASVGSDFVFKNTSGSPADVWTDKVQYGFADAHQIFYTSVPNGGTASVSVSGPVVLSGQALVKFTVSTAGRLTLIEARIVFTGAGECLFNAAATELAT
jgi:hypothetical protein